MAKKWRELPQERKNEYKKQAQKIEELPMDNLTVRAERHCNENCKATPSRCKLITL